MRTLEFSSQIAREAGEILLEYYHQFGVESSKKSDNTAVTQADIAADQFIRDRIRQTYPQDAILSEEANTISPEKKSSVWIIDPLDGTTNFSLGLHYWGVSIARLTNGYPETGVLFFPLLGEMITAAKGEGAFLNGVRLQVHPPDPTEKIRIFSHCSRSNKIYRIKLKYKTRILGSASYGLASVARGLSILALEVTPRIWDFSASWLIILEAGGVIGSLNGDDPFPLVPGIDYKKRSFPLLSAATQELLIEGRSKISIR